jgi:hypothetical protein
MDQVKVFVRHKVLRCDVCLVALSPDSAKPDDKCLICLTGDGPGILRPKEIEAEILVDKENLENVKEDPAFIRIVRGAHA